MKADPLVFGLVYDIAMIGLGSYGTYILIREFVESEHILSVSRILSVFQKRWYAVLALTIAIALFFHHIFIGLSSYK